MIKINGKSIYTLERKRKKKPVPKYQRFTPDNDYLKYYRVVRYWAMRQYDITGPELDVLLFLYSERLFNYSTFVEFCNIMHWDRARFKTLTDKELIHVWRRSGWKEIRLYELTYKAKRMVNSIYKKLNGEELIPLSHHNPVMSSSGSYTDKVYAMAIKRMNQETKERRQHPAPE